MSWSNRYRGNAARTHTNPNRIATTLIPNHKKPGIRKKSNGKGESHPPKKHSAVIVLIRIIFEYSPRKKRANPMAEYSVKYPATNSASASGKSKGARFVSAKIHTNQTITAGKRG